MICVNLYGVPGSGKSTAAAYIFYKLKEAGINCELVTEVAKDMVWDNNSKAFRNQLYIAGNQYYRIDRLSDKVDVVITDAPLMLQAVYYRLNNCPEPDMFEIIISRLCRKYDNINILLPIPNILSSIGRIHDISDCDKIHENIVEVLDKYLSSYICISNNIISYDKIVNDIISIVKGE